MISSAHLELIRGRKTPFYAYNMDLLRKTLEECRAEADRYKYKIHYALKANSNPVIASMIAGKGFGADCVSGNEVKFALNQGFLPSETVFAGVGKSDEEIKFSLQHNILCFNVESFEEIEVLNSIAASENKVATIALRLNPNVNANTHHYITTGLEENKFGISQQQLPAIFEKLSSWEHIRVCGIHFHIGSQITDLEVFKNLCTRVNEFMRFFAEKQIRLKIINVGGGLGVDYSHPEKLPIPDFARYFSVFHQFLEPSPEQEVHFELGRALVAHCGDLVSRVLYTKQGLKKKFVILDAGMTELLRPALYQAKHSIRNLSGEHNSQELVDVVGPVCESSDCFAKNIELPFTSRGDFIAIRTAGAYGEVMASSYNLRSLEEALYF